jgi:3-hydroxyisobutyrate dehydrogenase-like beta-hydroxyacid dehydrogenase
MAETIAEAHVFAEKTGLPSEIVDSLIHENYGIYAHSISEKLLKGIYAPAPGR